MNSTCIHGIYLEKHVEFYKATALVLNIIIDMYYNKDQCREIICNEYFNDTLWK